MGSNNQTLLEPIFHTVSGLTGETIILLLDCSTKRLYSLSFEVRP